jgi:hypothetical protein
MKRKLLCTTLLASLLGCLSVSAVDEDLVIRSPAGEVNRTKITPGRTTDSLNRDVKQYPARLQNEQSGARKAPGKTRESFDRSKTGLSGKLGPRPVKKAPAEAAPPEPKKEPVKPEVAKPDSPKPVADKAEKTGKDTPEPEK